MNISLGRMGRMGRIKLSQEQDWTCMRARMKERKCAFSRPMRPSPVLVRLPGFFYVSHTCPTCVRLWRIVPKNMPLQRLHPIEAPADVSRCGKGKMFFCTEQTLSRNPLYRVKMPSTAIPVVHGNRLLTPCPLPHGKQGKNRKQSGAEGG